MNNAAEKFFSLNPTLPTMPEIASKLLASFDDDRVGMADLSRIIAKDATLAAKVMRLANSAKYSPSKPVASLPDAAASLGMDALRNLSMAACVSGAFPSAHGLHRLPFWRHSLRSAGYARLLAKTLHLDSDTAYLAGLMARSGQLLMAASDPKGVAAVEAALDVPGSRFGAEKEWFACAHTDVTACLASHWRFPASLVAAFEDAADPLEALPFSPLAATLRLAELLSDCAELKLDPVIAIAEQLPELAAHLGLDLVPFRAILAKAGDLGSDAELLIS